MGEVAFEIGPPWLATDSIALQASVFQGFNEVIHVKSFVSICEGIHSVMGPATMKERQ